MQIPTAALKSLASGLGSQYITLTAEDAKAILDWEVYLNHKMVDAYHPEIGIIPELQEENRRLKEKIETLKELQRANSFRFNQQS